MTFLEKTVKNSKDMNDCLDKLAPLLRTFETYFNKVYIPCKLPFFHIGIAFTEYSLLSGTAEP